MILDPKEVPTRDFHQFLLGAVAPRPIAFVSTVDENGVPNLAPYSFFNAFSSNPPTLVFSSNRRVVNNTTKDTLHNIKSTREAVINVVNYDIVRHMAVTSIEFDSDISEFDKAGLTPLPSQMVKPFRVKESPVNMECRVKDIITLGNYGGAGHLIICEVVCMHVDDNIVDENNRIDPHKIDLMGRMGRAYYVRASGDAVKTIVQAVTKLSIGYDQLPDNVRNSEILTANNIGQLAGIHEMPTMESVEAIRSDAYIQKALKAKNPAIALQEMAKEILDHHDDRNLACLLYTSPSPRDS